MPNLDQNPNEPPTIQQIKNADRIRKDSNNSNQPFAGFRSLKQMMKVVKKEEKKIEEQKELAEGSDGESSNGGTDSDSDPGDDELTGNEKALLYGKLYIK